MSERERERCRPPPADPPAARRARAADLFPRQRTHYDEPGLDAGLTPICGEFVQVMTGHTPLTMLITHHHVTFKTKIDLSLLFRIFFLNTSKQRLSFKRLASFLAVVNWLQIQLSSRYIKPGPCPLTQDRTLIIPHLQQNSNSTGHGRVIAP